MDHDELEHGVIANRSEAELLALAPATSRLNRDYFGPPGSFVSV
jgi:hypothetical protein